MSFFVTSLLCFCQSQDIWAAGICLYIFVSGRLPFFSELPLELMETIAKGEVPFDELDVSDSLMSLIKITLEKDPEQRAGVGDCLQHPCLQAARKTRINQLSDEFILSHEKVTVGEDDIRAVGFAVPLHFLVFAFVTFDARLTIPS